MERFKILFSAAAMGLAILAAAASKLDTNSIAYKFVFTGTPKCQQIGYCGFSGFLCVLDDIIAQDNNNQTSTRCGVDLYREIL